MTPYFFGIETLSRLYLQGVQEKLYNSLQPLPRLYPNWVSHHSCPIRCFNLQGFSLLKTDCLYININMLPFYLPCYHKVD